MTHSQFSSVAQSTMLGANFFAAFLAALTATACGGHSDLALTRGFTDCSGVTCQPGQYCVGPGLCSPGCTSDFNCSANQSCDTANANFEGVSRCVATALPPAPDAGMRMDAGSAPSAPSTCEEACAYFGVCGLGPSGVANCRAECTDAAAASFILGCGSEACGAVAACLDFECIRDADCGSGRCDPDFLECEGGVAVGGGGGGGGGGLALGAACSASGECADGVCYVGPGQREGYCTTPCTNDASCNPLRDSTCGRPGGQPRDICVFDDRGQSCTFNNDCVFDTCLFRTSADISGYCTSTCESFADCPTFWNCEEIASGAGRRCVQN
ncbi:MAG: hypothetical protein AAF645_06585 [Myxococcota bacterium]